MKTRPIFAVLVIGVLALAGTAFAHCEIPCGIYDDGLRIKLIYEHAGTIEKSMKQIAELSKQNPVDYNQLVRWVANKDEHANKIQEIVSQYFMTQRIKPGVKDYDKMLGTLHEILIYAMKCKQTADVANTEKIKSLVGAFEALYPH